MTMFRTRLAVLVVFILVASIVAVIMRYGEHRSHSGGSVPT